MNYYKTNNRAIYNQWTITTPIIEKRAIYNQWTITRQ